MYSILLAFLIICRQDNYFSTSFPENVHVTVTNDNAEGSLQVQTLKLPQAELMGVLCEKGKC